MSERACTAHSIGNYEAEVTTRVLDAAIAEAIGREPRVLRYIVLRCLVCDRPQGLRLVRKNRVTS